jgi:hypothetical protein
MTGAADFHSQADALFRKNLAIQVSHHPHPAVSISMLIST